MDKTPVERFGTLPRRLIRYAKTTRRSQARKTRDRAADDECEGAPIPRMWNVTLIGCAGEAEGDRPVASAIPIYSCPAHCSVCLRPRS